MSHFSKRKIHEAIDRLPESALQRLLNFIQALIWNPPKKQPLKKYSLGGQFDDVKVRSRAYE